MNYRATFGIDYGVSYGLDIKFPDYQETEKILIADNDFMTETASLVFESVIFPLINRGQLNKNSTNNNVTNKSFYYIIWTICMST